MYLMSMNVQALLSRAPLVTRQSFDARDVILYALGLGVGAGEGAATAPATLDLTYEARLSVLPTMAIVLAAPPFWLDDPEIGMDWRKALNAGQELVLHAPLPTSGVVSTTLTIDAVYDKGAGKGALMLSHRVLRDESGANLATIHQTHILRGDGGFGGTAAPPTPEFAVPDRAPDAVHDIPTREDQALLYRLTGDLNPLHIDPEVAGAAGFPRPILHGSCTYGIVGRALLDSMAGGDAARFGSMTARFSRPVLPGDTIRTEMWREGDQVLFRARAIERDQVVLDHGRARIAP
jgi:acyl dehydratase